MGVPDKITEEFIILWKAYFRIAEVEDGSSRRDNWGVHSVVYSLESLFSYFRGGQMGVHDEITEEFIQSYILWNNYFRIAEVDNWEFTIR